MAKLKYLIGIQDFRKIREEAYRYIDKTELIHALLTQMEAKTPDIRYLVRKWYNGYAWDGQNHVYNPFSILNFLGSGALRNYCKS